MNVALLFKEECHEKRDKRTFTIQRYGQTRMSGKKAFDETMRGTALNVENGNIENLPVKFCSDCNG